MKADLANGHLTVGRVAQLAEVGVPTLRFYERAGLLPKPSRNASNYRLYDDEAVQRVRFIRRAQQLGFTLNEVKELLGLRVAATTSCADVRQRAEAKVLDVQARIRSLQRMNRALAKLASECGKRRSQRSCPILDYLEGNL